jgi:hypothetical protein
MYLLLVANVAEEIVVGTYAGHADDPADWERGYVERS